jgi:excisionase family DNA binding protein
MITAEKIYKKILEMPIKEREKLFTVIARRGFEKDLYSHSEVFDEIRQSPFTIKEASEYLELAVITLRRWVKAGNIAHRRVGRNIVFDPATLKAIKKNRQGSKHV